MNHHKKLMKLSAVMQYCCLAILLILPVINLLIWFDLELYVADKWQGLNIDVASINNLQIIIAAACQLLLISIMLFGVWHLYKLFRNYSQKQNNKQHLFNKENARYLYTFAITLVISALCKPFINALISVVLSFNNPPGQKAMAFFISSNDVANLFAGILILAVSWVLYEGEKIATENAGFI